MSVAYLLILSTPSLAAEPPPAIAPSPSIRIPEGGNRPAPTVPTVQPVQNPQPVRIPEGTRALPPAPNLNPLPSITPPAVNPAVLINDQIQQQGVLQVPRLNEVTKYLAPTTQLSTGRSGEVNSRGPAMPRVGEPQFIQFSPNIVILLNDESTNTSLPTGSPGLLPGTAGFGNGSQTQVVLESTESARPILVFKRASDSDRTLQASDSSAEETETSSSKTNNAVVLIDRTLPEDKTLIQTRQQFLFPSQVLLQVGADGQLQSINPR